MSNSDSLSYKQAGVDIEAGNRLVERIKPMVQQTLRKEVLTGLGGFGGLFGLDTSKYDEPVLVSGTDGVGTKLKLAQQMQCHDTIGMDLVAMCVNDVVVQGAEPLFFLDYFACGKLDEEQAAAVISGIAKGCKDAGCALIGGETAEMPDMYADGEYDLAGFNVGVVDRSKLVDGSGINAGDAIIGLASSGPHSNGYSLIRKIIERSNADLSAPFEQTTLGTALLAPTRIYVKAILRLLESQSIHGLAHITGGGLKENIIRVVPKGLGVEIDCASWSTPAIFRWLAEHGNVEPLEMLTTFNCGIGFTVIAPESDVADIVAQLSADGIAASKIGNITEPSGDAEAVQFHNLESL